jgi:glycine betaine/proline transport system substrate-binding protein
MGCVRTHSHHRVISPLVGEPPDGDGRRTAGTVWLVNASERKGLVAAAIAVTIALLVIVVGVVVDGGGDSIALAGSPTPPSTPSGEAPTIPDPPSSPDETTPPASPGESAPSQPDESVVPPDASGPPTTLPSNLPLRPGEGVEVMTAQSVDQALAVPAEVTAALLRELGYVVFPPDENALDDDDAYSSLASGETDIWIAGHYPLDETTLTQPFEDATIGDFAEPVGELAVDGSRVGLAIDRVTASELNVSSLEALLNNPDAVETYDRDGNGLPDAIFCDGGATCGLFLQLLGEANLLDEIDIISASVTDPSEDVLERFRNGEPVLFVLEEPHWLASVLLTGGDIVWLSLDDEVALSPEIDSDECSSDPCRLGIEVNDIRSVANTCFVDENPAARGLLEAVTFDRIELAVLDAQLRAGRDPFGVSAVWIEEHRDTVDEWLGAARLAAVQNEPEPCDGGGGANNPA